MNTQLIALEKIQDNPYQPRATDDVEHIEKLARSIAADGLLQPPTARLHSNGQGDKYQLAFGHSRRKAFEWLASNWEKLELLERYHGYTSMPLEVAHLSDEEMYRQAITENVQRRDLTPTELAGAMQKYMDDFGASSKQTAELFGVKDATVRGTVRYLDLPAEAQKALDEGKISQNTARSLLSMQKVATEAVVTQAVKEIVRTEGRQVPDDVVEHLLDRLDTVVEMHPSHRDGKPRAGHHLWLLDMKDFPNNMLEHLAPGDYVEIGLVKMKELTKAHTDYSLGNKNADLPEELKMRIDQLANPPSCGACAFHTVISGNHYCGVKVCHERKKAAWFKYKTEQASKQLKIDMYELRHGQFRVLEYRDEDLFKKRQAGLRLIERPKVSGYHYQSFKGVDDDIFLVVATGEALNKITRSKSNAKGGGKKTEKEKAEARAMRIFRPRVRELRWEYTAVAMHIFDGVPLAALERLNSRWFVGIDDRVPDEYEPAENAQASKKLEFNKRALVWRLILDASSTWHREPLADILTEMQETVPVKVPKALIKQVAEWDAEIAEAAKVVKPVAVETGKKKS